MSLNAPTFGRSRADAAAAQIRERADGVGGDDRVFGKLVDELDLELLIGEDLKGFAAGNLTSHERLVGFHDLGHARLGIA